MTSTASHSANPPHGRPVQGAASAAAAVAALAAVAEGRLPVGPAGLPGGPAWSGGPGALGGPAGPAGPWSVRSVAAGRDRGRAALEVYEHGELVDVLVASRLGGGLLRGARAWAGPGTGAGLGLGAGLGARRRRRHGLAWGRLPKGGTVPVVGFTGRRLLRLPGRPAPAPVPAEVVTVAGEFWLGWAEGVFDGVLVEAAGGAAAERSPLTRALPVAPLAGRLGGAR
ncbi:hypothetical protein [Kitasatospora sp. NPDC093806]|uniref:hypothetical protein n=1 Tax=Kitasatospora sp. NPDC093806 TaxID=3155075 RepID=UPI00343D44F4